MDNNVIKIEGLDELVKKIKDLGELKRFVVSMKAAAEHIEGIVRQYPPASEANAPGQKRWYERGYGPRWTRMDGSIGGSKTSKDLKESWTIKQENGGLTQIVGTKVKYGPFAMDEAQQASFHKRRGWKTIQTVVREQTARISQFIKAEMDKIINRK